MVLKCRTDASKKKQALAGFLADLYKIHEAYARSAYQESTVSVNKIYHKKAEEVKKKPTSWKGRVAQKPAPPI